MNIEELLAEIAKYDEMEKEDGMNLLEATVEKEFIGDGKIVKSDLLDFGIGIKPLDSSDISRGIYFGGISYGPSAKSISVTDYAGENVIDDVAAIIEKHVTAIEEEIKALLGLI